MTHKIIFLNNSGNCTHYFHFFYGVYLPLTAYLLDNKCDSLVVQDCGPMNRHLFSNPAVVKNGVALSVAPLSSLSQQGATVIRGWDYGHIFDRRSRRWKTPFVGRHIRGLTMRPDVRSFLKDSFAANGPARESILIIHRAKPAAEYGESNSGANRRCMNTREVYESLVTSSPQCEVTLFVPEMHSIEEQAKTFASAGMIVGQHGAALANLYFASPGSKVLEINRAGRRYFQRISGVIGLTHKCWDINNRKNGGLYVQPAAAVREITTFWGEDSKCTSSK